MLVSMLVALTRSYRARELRMYACLNIEGIGRGYVLVCESISKFATASHDSLAFSETERETICSPARKEWSSPFVVWEATIS
jgi:hypothetical protein